MVVEKVMNFMWRLNESINTNNKYSLLLKNIESLESTAMQIMCLDVIGPLKQIIDQSACVVLAGGTMEPLSEFELLINEIGRDNYFHFSCGHVIDDDNCTALCVGNITNNNNSLLFNYQNKQSNSLLTSSIFIIEQLAS